MTDDRLPLGELAAKSGDSDFVRAICRKRAATDQHRYMQVEAFADLNTPAIEDGNSIQITPRAA